MTEHLHRPGRRIRSRVPGAVTAAVVTVGCLAGMPGPAASAATPAGVDIGVGGSFRIQASYSFCAAAPAGGGPATLSFCARSVDATEAFTLDRVGSGLTVGYRIRNTTSGRCLQVGATAAPGTATVPVDQGSCANGQTPQTQLFDLTRSPVGSLTITGRALGGCLDGDGLTEIRLVARRPGTPCGSYPLGLVDAALPAGSGPVPTQLAPGRPSAGASLTTRVTAVLAGSFRTTVFCSGSSTTATGLDLLVDGRSVGRRTCEPYRGEGGVRVVSDVYPLAVGNHTVTVTALTAVGPQLLVPQVDAVEAPAPGARLVWSGPKRAKPTALEGASLGSPVAIWLQGPSQAATRQVVFSVDGRQVRTEALAEYDLGSTASDGTSTPFAFGPGRHTVTAVLTPTSGPAQTFSASFTVRVPQEVPRPTDAWHLYNTAVTAYTATLTVPTWTCRSGEDSAFRQVVTENGVYHLNGVVLQGSCTAGGPALRLGYQAGVSPPPDGVAIDRPLAMGDRITVRWAASGPNPGSGHPDGTLELTSNRGWSQSVSGAKTYGLDNQLQFNASIAPPFDGVLPTLTAGGFTDVTVNGAAVQPTG